MERFQNRVFKWAMSCLGKKNATDLEERRCRFFEESCELVQAAGLPKEKAQIILDHVYSCDVGDLEQEVGCVMLTLGVFCESQNIDLEACAEAEYERVSSRPDKIRQKYYAKPPEIRGNA